MLAVLVDIYNSMMVYVGLTTQINKTAVPMFNLLKQEHVTQCNFVAY